MRNEDNRGNSQISAERCDLTLIASFERRPSVDLEYMKRQGLHHPTSKITANMPVTKFNHPDPYKYQTGFDSYHEYVYT